MSFSALQEGSTAHPLRVCLTTETYYPVIGGGETQARALTQDLVAAGVPVIVVTRRSDAKFARAERLDGAWIYRLAPSGPGHLKKWGMVLTGLIFFITHARQYDIILVSGFRVLGIPAVLAALLMRKKVILKADNNGEMSGAYFTEGIKSLRLQWAWRALRGVISLRNALFRRADAFVSVSTDIVKELTEQGVPRGMIECIPNSYDPQRFYPAESEETRRVLRAQLNLPQDKKLVIFTGRLLRGKGLPLLVRVWKDLSVRHPQAALIIVGAGGNIMSSCEDEIRSFVSEHGLSGSVVFTGGVRNVEDYLRSSDLFVFPTEDEAFGISLIEAMACGLPPVASRVGGIKDIVVDGDTGLLVPPSEHAPLHDALDLLLRDSQRAREIGQRAAVSVRQRYSRQTVLTQYMSLFGRLAGSGISARQPMLTRPQGGCDEQKN